MNLQELRQSLGFLFNPEDEIGLSMYFILDMEGALSIKKADITAEVRTTLRDQFLNYIRVTFLVNQDLYFANITLADSRKNAAYYFDIDQLPDGLSVMKDLIDDEDADLFDFNTDPYESITGFVFLLGNETEKIALYKKQYPINLLKRGSILRVYKVGTRLDEVTEDIISLNEKVDFMQLGDDVVIINVNTLEKFFGFEDVIKGQAQLSLGVIETAQFVLDITSLQEMVSELSFARKLMRVRADSPVLQLPFDRVRDFIKQHPQLKRRMRFNADETRISLDTKTSKQLFLKLLDDDFLKSDLTQFLYETDIKNRLTEEEATD